MILPFQTDPERAVGGRSINLSLAEILRQNPEAKEIAQRVSTIATQREVAAHGANMDESLLRGRHAKSVPSRQLRASYPSFAVSSGEPGSDHLNEGGVLRPAVSDHPFLVGL